jgi:hypothetical protein
MRTGARWLICVVFIPATLGAACADNATSDTQANHDGGRQPVDAGRDSPDAASGGDGAKGPMGIDISWRERGCGEIENRDLFGGSDPSFACSYCALYSCCEVMNRCAAALGSWKDRPPGAGCGPQADCGLKCVTAALERGVSLSHDLVSECLHDCPGEIPPDEWPSYEHAVREQVECFLSAPAVRRTGAAGSDEDAGALWEVVEEEDAGSRAPGGCFNLCCDSSVGWCA